LTHITITHPALKKKITVEKLIGYLIAPIPGGQTFPTQFTITPLPIYLTFILEYSQLDCPMHA